ncbi:MAG: zinc ribbon domain-containing protein [Novosphingobium sp.]|jgi:3-hydroxyacyl-CoA dehydrogenase|nr:zinc ribbon domain-containing protein [Novosphingobium sp.]
MAHERNPIDVFPEMREFWQAAAENRLLFKRCKACSRAHYYPRALCPFCQSSETEWWPSSGRGTIYSYSVARREAIPCAPVVVELEDGIRLTSVVVHADLDALHIGGEVTLHTLRGAGPPEIAFSTPEADAARDHARRVIDAAPQVPGLPAAHDADFQSAAIVGAGTMGVGITMAFVNAGIPVMLLDRDDASLQRALGRIREQYEIAVQRKRLDAAAMRERLGLIAVGTDIAAIATADVVIEAVWEQMGLKRETFALIDQHARPGALLGSNTSALDVNEIAAATRRPHDVLGLHFFTPAQSMKLLEIVRGRATSPQALARALVLGQRLKKTPVIVEVAPGFVGNRMFGRREQEARRMLLEGAPPEQIDRVLTDFGMPMGSFELADMTSGIELGYRRRQETGQKDPLGDRMFESGRVGQKVGKGFYKYDPGSRKPKPDPELGQMLAEIAREVGIERRAISDDEIRDRLILSMINEGAKLLEERVTERAGDIDAVWLQGYGWPTWRGGPMYYADRVGIAELHRRLQALMQIHGERFAPSPLLTQMAAEGRGFFDGPAHGVQEGPQ